MSEAMGIPPRVRRSSIQSHQTALCRLFTIGWKIWCGMNFQILIDLIGTNDMTTDDNDYERSINDFRMLNFPGA
jgi:hypothetical protein